ncbi:hypothetical protein Raf01_27950 [Rugosimonospora africana]|uniref:Uncharacterized protein n=1 Tax=Rugosimonospora africana TaxID=556532 RepID=A0A8J3VQR9_9ACTN|nr:hypothetical protein Raf01_27950 [Rugosimonospora africana]
MGTFPFVEALNLRANPDDGTVWDKWRDPDFSTAVTARVGVRLLLTGLGLPRRLRMEIHTSDL